MHPRSSLGHLFLNTLLLWLLGVTSASAATLTWSDAIRSSVVVRAVDDPAAPYPHRLRVYLVLENIHDADVTWVSEDPLSVDAELFDPTGKPAPMPPTVASVMSGKRAHHLPVGSRLEWLISDQGGVGMSGDIANCYALVVGMRGWLIPRAKLKLYSLRLTLHGRLWSSDTSFEDPRPPEKLLELPPIPLRQYLSPLAPAPPSGP